MTFLDLTAFQLAMTIGILAALGAVLVAVWQGKLRRREALLWCAILAAGATAILWPGVTSHVARFLGIGRGADLVLYLAVVAMFVGFWMVYLRLRQLRRDITLLVRHLAIEQTLSRVNADATGAPPPSGPTR